MKFIQYPTLLLPLVATALPALATEEIAPIVVTATRTAQTADETLAPVSVITREDIEKSQAGNLTELLAGTTGIDVTETGWYGQSSGYFIRGASSKHILVLIDGVRLGSATTGSTELTEIGLEHIERIEIVRGPRSSLYGSDAVGGVIQIFTQQKRPKNRANINIGFGSYNTRTISTDISGSSDNTQVQLNVSHLETDGANVSESNNPDRDGHEVSRFSASLRQQLSKTSALNLSIYQNQGTTEYDGYTASSSYAKESVKRSISAGLNLAPTSDWILKLQTSHGRDESDNYQDGILNDIFHTQRMQYSWQNDLSLSDTTLLTLGIDKTDEQIDSLATSYTETARSVLGSFAELQQNFGAQDLLFSIRNDRYNAIGQHTTGNIDWGITLDNDLRLTAGYGTAFKAPTFNDLYYPNMPWGIGNPNLLPESSNSFEVGLQGKSGLGSWSINAFRTRIDELIEWQCTSNCATPSLWDDVYQPFNVSSVQIDGIESSLQHRANNLERKVSITLLDPKDLATGNLLQNRAQATLRAEINMDYEQWNNGITLLAQGARYADSTNTRELGGYTTVDLQSRYRLNRRWQLKGKVRNLFDKNYLTTDRSYQPSARTLMFTLSYNPSDDS